MKKLVNFLLVLALLLCCAAVCLAEDHTCSGGTATCDQLAVCDICGKTYGHLAGHNWGPWFSDDSSTHTRTCRTNLSHIETRYHMGGGSTCTEGAKCALCGAVHDAPLGHVSVFQAGYPATCTSAGITDGSKCSRCGAVLNGCQVIPARGHSFSLWEPLPGSLHTAVCATPGCNSADVLPCPAFEATLDDGAVSVCPICGVSGEIVFPILFFQPEEALPMGQLLVRGMEAPFNGVLYAFTLTGSYGGKVVEPDAEMKIYLQEGFFFFPEFHLVRVNVTPATKNAERKEIWADIPYRLVDGNLIFFTDASGLFLLVPKE